MYTIAKYGPEPEYIYLFSGEFFSMAYPGNFYPSGDPEKECVETYLEYYSYLDVVRIKPLISTSDLDARDIVPDRFSHVQVMGVDSAGTPSLVSTSWAEIWTTGNIDFSLGDTMGIVTNYWTGSNINGYFDSANSCNNWSSKLGTDYAVRGDPGMTSTSWINSSPAGCNQTYTLVCVGY
ncbi:MAG: hypothetical protein ACOCWZ_08335 [Spirochaetota bacterium]